MKRILSVGAVCALLFGALSLPAGASDYSSVPYLVKDIDPGHFSSGVDGAVTLGSKLIFSATDGGQDAPWVSDGSKAGTKKLADIGTGCSSGSLDEFVALTGKVYFAATDAADGCELWATDGTAAGTHQIADLRVGSGSSNPFGLAVSGGTLFFGAQPVSGGAAQLFKYSPVQIGPVQPPTAVTAFGGTTGINNVTPWGTKVIFNTTLDGGEPWIYDPGAGTPVFRLKDINPGGGSQAQGFTPLGSSMFFEATDGTHGLEVWKTNGTSLGTTQAFDIDPGASGSNPREFFAYNGELLFRTSVSAVGDSIWSTDGSAAHELYGIFAGSSDNTADWVSYKGYVYFAGKGSEGGELWRTKGGTLSTQLVKNINTGTSDSSPTGMRVVNGILYFSATDASHGNELWRSDGTSTGTKIVKDIFPGSGGGGPNNSFTEVLGSASNTLFFSAIDATHGRELWAYNTKASTTKGYPKSSYSTSTDSAHKIKLTVRVKATATLPTGKVVLKKGTKTVGSGTLSHGAVTIQLTSKLGKGTTTLRAYYLGSVQARASHSGSISVKVK